MAVNIRTHAIDALLDWQEGRHYADSLVHRYTRDQELKQEDRNLLNAIVVGVIRNQSLLDHYVAILREGKIDNEVRTALRVGIYQVLFMGVADHAAVNETVEGIRKGIRGLVNACLRRLLREKEELEKTAESLPINVKYSHPKWLYDRWAKTYSDEQIKGLLEWNQAHTITTFRLNPLEPAAQEVVEESTRTEPLEGHPGFYIFPSLPPRQWMDDGLIYIQDPATQHAAALLEPKPGETILDACAAPGGKSTQMAALMQNEGTLICTDSNEKRLPRLLENLDNLNIRIAETEVHDWTEAAPEKWHGHFDGILLDVPCSNTGVLRKRIDARWRMTPENFTELRELQLQILENAAPCIKPDGRLVYSTCSIDPEENTQLIAEFLTKHPELTLVEEKQITPFEHQTDGAYVALIKRK